MAGRRRRTVAEGIGVEDVDSFSFTEEAKYSLWSAEDVESVRNAVSSGAGAKARAPLGCSSLSVRTRTVTVRDYV